MDPIEQPVARSSVISAMFLVGGTCIGGGMLALPVATGVAGFFPSLLVMLVCWLAMTISALLLLEVSLWMNEGAHMISMSQRMLGNPGRVVAWILYLFIGYASVVAYTAGGGAQLSHAFEMFSGTALNKPISCSLFLVLFGAVIYLGSATVGRVNTILFSAMVIAYVALLGVGVGHVDTELLMHRKWSVAWLSVPMFLTAFSFQTMVPSLTPMLGRHAKHLRWAIVGGTTLAMLSYLMWQWLVLGIIPAEGPDSLAQAFAVGAPATHYLKAHVGSGLIFYIAEYFAFFALVTSFLGIALGLWDFLADGLRIRKDARGKIILSLLIALPTLWFAVNFERAFLVALDSTGGYGDSILNGVMPVLMVWVGRYHMGLKSQVRVPGGRVLLVLVGLFFAGCFVFELANHLGFVGP